MRPKQTFAVLVGFLAVWCCSAVLLQAQEIAVTTDRPEGIYQIGEKILWRVDGRTLGAVEAEYRLKKNNFRDLLTGKLNLQSPQTIEIVADEPGTLLLEVKVTTPGSRELRSLGGAVVAWEQIERAGQRPADFDAFWERKIRELEAVPLHAELEEAPSGTEGVAYWKIVMDHIGGTKIHGQLARPISGEKFPALLIVQWAGVYGLQKKWVTDPARAGYLVLNILPHDLPIDAEPAFYEAQAKGPLKDYWAIGNDDREKSYYLRMYLSCYRAAEYLASREDWNGRTLVVSGASQGGMQALVTAALNPKVTAAMALVPAGCDFEGKEAGRAPGWPMWNDQIEGKDPQKVRETGRYYDVVNFASRIRCPVLVGVGLLDELCPPSGIFAAVNQIRGPKEVLILARSDHSGTGGTQQPYFDRSWQWLMELKEGKRPWEK